MNTAACRDPCLGWEGGVEHMGRKTSMVGKGGGTCGEVRGGNVLHELLDGDVWVVDQRTQTIHHFPQIVRRDIGGNANCNA